MRSAEMSGRRACNDRRRREEKELGTKKKKRRRRGILAKRQKKSRNKAKKKKGRRDRRRTNNVRERNPNAMKPLERILLRRNMRGPRRAIMGGKTERIKTTKETGRTFKTKAEMKTRFRGKDDNERIKKSGKNI